MLHNQKSCSRMKSLTFHIFNEFLWIFCGSPNHTPQKIQAASFRAASLCQAYSLVFVRIYTVRCWLFQLMRCIPRTTLKMAIWVSCHLWQNKSFVYINQSGTARFSLLNVVAYGSSFPYRYTHNDRSDNSKIKSATCSGGKSKPDSTHARITESEPCSRKA